MKKVVWAAILVLALLALVFGCEESSPDEEQVDGDTPDGDVPDGDTPDGEEPDGDGTDGDPEDGDGPDGDTTDGDEPDGDDVAVQCEEFSGAYDLVGACDPALLSFFNFACVRQAENCDMELFVTSAAFVGQAQENGFELESVYSTAPTTCTGLREIPGDPVAITCEVPDYSVTCIGEATPIPPIADATSACCDACLQDCGASDRCTVVSHGEQRPFVSACIADTGAVSEGESCSRSVAGLAGVGRDDCAKGLMCVNYGSPSLDQRFCRRFCAADSDCGQGEACNAGMLNVPRIGVCSPSCDPFGDGEECAGGTACAMITGINRDSSQFLASGFCMPGQNLAAGEVCQFNGDCRTGHVCSPVSGRYRNLCDNEHPCEISEQSCVGVFGVNYRFCEEN